MQRTEMKQKQLRNLNNLNNSPLHTAILSRSKEMMNLLINKGANINAKNNTHLFNHESSKEKMEYLISK